MTGVPERSIAQTGRQDYFSSMKICFLFFAVVCCTSHSLEAQENVSPSPLKNAVLHELRFEQPRLQEEPSSFGMPFVTPAFEDRKSPFLAAGLSLAVPGLGDLYAEEYLYAGIFIAAEAALWYFNIHNNTKGDDATAFYQSYADQHWNVVKYADWLNKHAKNFKGGENAKPIDINPNETLPPWERVNWQQMNEVESMIPVFSHRLPPHGDQQYFEMIGKYNQYSYGWSDKLANGGDGWSDYWEISDRFGEYSGLRGKANDFYNTASTFANLIVLNHVLSAANAAWSAIRFNQNIDLESHAALLPLPDGSYEIVTTATVRYRFR